MTILHYQKRWVDEFTSIARDLKKNLGNIALKIDHIGSTSVPGLSAKDIIDIQITVENIDEFDEFKSRMVARGGYRMKSAYQEDQRPPGDESSSWHW